MKKRGVVLLMIIMSAIGAILILYTKNSKNGYITKSGMNRMIVKSNQFVQNGSIPKNFTCDGNNISPSLNIAGIPANAKSLVLIVDDPDAPIGTWTHWLVWNIDPKTTEIQENTVPTGSVAGKNDFGQLKYGGPCPPSGTHRYFFKLFALDALLSLPEGSERRVLENSMKGHILDKIELIGTYSR